MLPGSIDFFVARATGSDQAHELLICLIHFLGEKWQLNKTNDKTLCRPINILFPHLLAYPLISFATDAA